MSEITPATLAPDLSDPALYINRELSWLEFNRRCLGEALNPELPLLERVRFLSIFSNNLDEFFMVRVSGLKDQVSAGVFDAAPDGLSPQQQLDAIRAALMPMLQEQRRVYYEDILPQLAQHGIHVLGISELSEAQRAALARYFETDVFPILTPLAVDPGRPFPHISNLSLSLAVIIIDDDGQERFARVKVPTVVPRLLSVNDILKAQGQPLDVRNCFVWLEDLIAANLDLLFPGLRIVASSAFRITRNSDMDIAEEEASDLLETVEEGVQNRRFGHVVRLCVDDTMPQPIRDMLLDNLEIAPEDVYTMRAPLGMSALSALANIDVPHLKFPPYIPSRPASTPPNSDIFAAIRRGDILIHRPYDSFTPVVEFFQQAAEDPNVLAIKTTLYRVGSNSPIVEALLKAQENNKQVAVLVELKARFDEVTNIVWARALEEMGVHVVYGLVGLKTHSKITMVVRKEPEGMRRYVHMSTGNYNTTTARIYTDICMLTCREDIAADATALFNRITGYSKVPQYRKLLIAPDYLRKSMKSLIRREIQHAQEGRDGHLILKMNSLTDPEMIRLLYTASMAGVRADLLVRGVCCLRPGIPGVSDNIRVTCLIGRYLEHARLYYFANGGEPEVYSGSADLMQRNLNRRVETLFPIESAAHKTRVIEEILKIELQDNAKARVLLPDGTYKPVEPNEGEPTIDAQRWFMEHSRDHGA
jgi:polyphosphate kinase